VAKYQRIVFDRKEGASGDATTIRLYESNPKPARTLTMQFKSLGIADGDRLKVEINGHTVPADSVKRTFDADGQNARQGRPCGPFHRHVFRLKHEWLKSGANRLRVTLAHDSGQGGKQIVAKEFEVLVK